MHFCHALLLLLLLLHLAGPSMAPLPSAVPKRSWPPQRQNPSWDALINVTSLDQGLSILILPHFGISLTRALAR